MSIQILIAPVVLAVVATVMGHLRAPGVRVAKTMVTVVLTGIAAWEIAQSGNTTATGSPLMFAIPLVLALTAIADWLLAPVDNSATFIGGLLFFLGAYLIYAVVFLVWSISVVFRTPVGPLWAIMLLLLVGAVGLFQYRTLSRVAEDLRLPVQVYMVVASLLLTGGLWLLLPLGLGVAEDLPFSSQSAVLFASGAIWIYISDSLIAHNLFRRSLPKEELWIMPTYYVGQLSIVAALLVG